MEKDPFEEYLKQAEPSKREKSYAWRTAIGLQKVDGLEPSRYLIDTAIKNIEGDITIKEAQALLNSYYKENGKINNKGRTEEADKVSAQITELLSEKAFSFSTNEYISIHKKLFDGIYDYAGILRNYNITKKEWVLNGETVVYGTATELRSTLDYDINQEKKFNYKGLSIKDIISHLAAFVSGLWQIHAFGEGNTRTTAVFFIKYLRTLGYNVTNDIFAENAWYFRNALVRANYTDLKNDIHSTTEYLELFLENLLLNKGHRLLNRTMHVNYISDEKVDIGSKKVDIQAKKVDIESLCKGKLPNISAKSIGHILKIYEVYGSTKYFGRSDVIEAINIKPAMASKFIKLLLDNQVIKPVQGHGKGKYVFVI